MGCCSSSEASSDEGRYATRNRGLRAGKLYFAYTYKLNHWKHTRQRNSEPESYLSLTNNILDQETNHSSAKALNGQQIRQ